MCIFFVKKSELELKQSLQKNLTETGDNIFLCLQNLLQEFQYWKYIDLGFENGKLSNILDTLHQTVESLTEEMSLLVAVEHRKMAAKMPIDKKITNLRLVCIYFVKTKIK